MELAWNICPHCGTPELGMRREGLSMDDVLRNLKIEDNAEIIDDEVVDDEVVDDDVVDDDVVDDDVVGDEVVSNEVIDNEEVTEE